MKINNEMSIGKIYEAIEGFIGGTNVASTTILG